MHKNILIFLWLITGYLLKAQQNLTVEVHAGDYPRMNTPVFVKMPKTITHNNFRLVNTKTGRKLPAQLTDSNTLVFIADTIAAGSLNRYTVERSTSAPYDNGITANKQANGLMIKVKDKPLLFYHTEEAQPPADSPGYYRRSGFIHPLYSPGGKMLTDDFPAGHAHQHGVFYTWVNTTFRNTAVDFWNQHKQTGTVEHVEMISIHKGQVLTELKLRLEHKSPEHGEILNETWIIRIYPFTEYFLFDLESEQRNVMQDTLFLHQYHYGGLAFRGSREWNPDDRTYFKNKWNILTSEGMKDSMANQTHAKWVNAYGQVDGKIAGVTIFDHPFNYRYPQAIRVHPTMPYWCYSPVIDGPFLFVPGKPFRSRFRYLMYDGTPPADLINSIEKNWTNPPSGKVVL